MQYQHEEDERFLFIMAALAETTSQEATPMKIKIYAIALQDLHIDDIEKGAWNLINTRTFATFPKPAEIRDAICGKAEDKAILAANTIESATSHGPYKSMVFEDPFIHATIHALGGWEHFCDISASEEWVFFKKEIEKTYKALSSRNINSLEVPIRLAGFVERNNSSMGIDLNENPHARPKIEYIGDREKIKEWRLQAKQITDKKQSQQLGQDIKQLIQEIG